MADPFAAPAEPQAPAPQPAALSPEIEALIAQRVQALTDTRVSGLQSLYDKKLAEQDRKYQAEMDRLRKGIPDFVDDEPDPVDSEMARKVAELERQNAILRARQQYGKGAPAYERLIALESAEEQIAFLEELQAAQATPAPTPPPAPPTDDVEVPDVDPNRPPIRDMGWAPGSPMTDEVAARILASATEWPTLPR